MSDKEKPLEKPAERPKEAPVLPKEMPPLPVRPPRPKNRETFEVEIIRTPGRVPDEGLPM